MGVQPSWKLSGFRGNESAGGWLKKNIRFDRPAEPSPRQAREIGQVEEEEFLGKGEVFLEQGVTSECLWRAGEHPFVRFEPDRPEVVGAEDQPFFTLLLGLTADFDSQDIFLAAQVVQEQFVESKTDPVLAAQVESELIDRQLREGRRRLAAERELDEGPGVVWLVVDRDPPRVELDSGDDDRPECRRVDGAEPALLPLSGPRPQPGSGRDPDPLGRAGLPGPGHEPGDRHRRHRSLVVREDQSGEGVGDLGILVVDLGPDPRRQECDSFQESLDMGVLAGARRDLEAAGDLRVLFPEFRPHVAEEAELPLVIVLELIGHPGPP